MELTTRGLPKPLSSDEIADRYRVSPQSVLRWIKGGQLKAFKTPGGGRWFISPDEIERFERQRG